jgi:large subunit ribosomal protein L4
MSSAMTALAAAPARFVGLRRAAPAPAVRLSARPSSRPAAGALQVRASLVAEPASLSVKGLDGSSKGEQSLSLKVVEDDKAKGLVHRYIVTVRQNARQVRP